MLTRLVLRDFRNYRELALDVGSKKIALIGANGQGKTNFLEAVFFLSMLRSFRTHSLRELKLIGSNGFYIGGEILNSREDRKSLEVEYFQNRRLKIDGQAVHKASDFIRQFGAVVFSPDDIRIITGPSALRRKFFDMTLSMMVPEYFFALQDYSKALRNRNAILRRSTANEDLAKAYETILASNGVKIVSHRRELAQKLESEVGILLGDIRGGKPAFSVIHRIGDDALNPEAYLARLRKDWRRDCERGHTVFGPHADDFEFIFEEKSLRAYGSTGQCRLTALCLKMAKCSFFSGGDGMDDFVVLVDDVTGELDSAAKEAFFSVILGAGQIFFTLTDSPTEEFFHESTSFKVENGRI